METVINQSGHLERGKMNIAFCTMEQFDNRERNSVGSSRIRARWLWEIWKEVYPKDNVDQYTIGEKYDVMIFQKVYWKQMLKAFEGKKIIDLCDPDWLEGKDVMEYISMCDYCTTSTQNLADYISKFVKTPIKYIPDRVKLSEHIPRGKHVGKARKICWFGYSTNQHYLYPTLEILRDYGISLHVISNQSYTPPMGYTGLIEIVNHSYAYPSCHDLVKDCDLYLSPERQDERGKFKSNNKELTAMALGVPVVRVPEDIERLKDADARNAQMDADLIDIKENWDCKLSVKELKEVINSI